MRRLEDQNCAHDSRCGLINALCNCSNTSRLLYSIPLAINAKIPFAFFKQLAFQLGLYSLGFGRIQDIKDIKGEEMEQVISLGLAA